VLIQRNAMEVWQQGGQLKERLTQDRKSANISPKKKLRPVFELG